MNLPSPDPFVTPETEPFWAAARDGRLALPRCTACATVIWYPRRFCPGCGSADVEWFDASGRGHVHSFAVAHRGQGAYRGATPYVLAYVELDEGPRILTNIVGVEPGAIEIDMAVEATFTPTEGGWALVRFRPVS